MLEGDGFQHVVVVAGDHVAGSFQTVPVLREDQGVAVVAAQRQRHEARVFGAQLAGDLFQRAGEAFRLAGLRHDAAVGEAAGRKHLDLLAQHHDAARYAVGAVELAHVAVRKERAAHDDGHETPGDLVFRHERLGVPFLRGGGIGSVGMRSFSHLCCFVCAAGSLCAWPIHARGGHPAHRPFPRCPSWPRCAPPARLCAVRPAGAGRSAGTLRTADMASGRACGQSAAWPCRRCPL